MTLSSVGSTVTERMSPSNIFSQVAPPSVVRYSPSCVTPTKTRSGVCLQPKMESMMPSSKCRPTSSHPLFLERQINNPCWVPAYKRTPSLIIGLLRSSRSSRSIRSSPLFYSLPFDGGELERGLWKQFASTRGRLAVPTGLETTKIIPGSLRPTLQRDLGAEGATFLRADRADLAQGRRLHRLFGVIFEHQGGEENFLKISAGDHDAVTAQQNRALVADDFQQATAPGRSCDQLGLGVKRHALAEDCALQRHRLEFSLRDGEESRVRRVQVRDGDRVGARAVQGRVDGPFDRRTHSSFQRFAVKIGNEHILSAETPFIRAHPRRDKDPLRFGLINADVTEDTDHSLHRKNARTGGKLFA